MKYPRLGLLFCDPDCPFCPPGIFHLGGGGRGGGEDSDGDHDSDDDDGDDEDSQFTMYAETLLVDDYPTILPDSDGLKSLWTMQISRLASEMAWLLTTTTQVSKTAPTTTTTMDTRPLVTPQATCKYYNAGFFYVFYIYNIAGWNTNDVQSSLRQQEKGCGALTAWDWDYANAEDFSVSFNLPILIKGGCVERAVFSAGGPKISCTKYEHNDGFAFPGPGIENLDSMELAEAHRMNGNQEHVPYKPMDWATFTV